MYSVAEQLRHGTHWKSVYAVLRQVPVRYEDDGHVDKQGEHTRSEVRVISCMMYRSAGHKVRFMHTRSVVCVKFLVS
jgi:hypothetical protein